MAYSGDVDRPDASNHGPELPIFPHLPADVAHAIAEFDREVGTAALPLDSDGHPHIPASAEQWIADNVHAHTHYECKHA